VYASLGIEGATWEPWITGLGDKNVALTLAAAVSLGLLAARKREGPAALASPVQAALQSGGVIILITAAGGAFGAVLQQTGISTRIAELSRVYEIGLLPLAFGCTVLVRTAQGSATVAMITATGIVSGLMDTATLGYHPLYVALAIGCGSKPFAWMNDSGFWVICRMSGLTESEGLRIVTPLSAGMGFFGFGLVLLAARWLPLV
jgi:GntP family gluconate:H+ symporter